MVVERRELPVVVDQGDALVACCNGCDAPLGKLLFGQHTVPFDRGVGPVRSVLAHWTTSIVSRFTRLARQKPSATETGSDSPRSAEYDNSAPVKPVAFQSSPLTSARHGPT